MKTVEEHMKKIVSSHRRHWREPFLWSTEHQLIRPQAWNLPSLCSGNPTSALLSVILVILWLRRWPRGSVAWRLSSRPSASEGVRLSDEGPLWPPGKFLRIPWRWWSLTLPSAQNHRKVAWVPATGSTDVRGQIWRQPVSVHAQQTCGLLGTGSLKERVVLQALVIVACHYASQRLPSGLHDSRLSPCNVVVARGRVFTHYYQDIPVFRRVCRMMQECGGSIRNVLG